MEEEDMINMTDEIKKVGIIGAGTMGKEIGKSAALHGYEISVYDVDSEPLEDAKEKISQDVQEEIGEEKLEELSFHTNISNALEDTNLVIEAVPENLELKKKIFSQIDENAPSDAIIATNSSSIPVSKIEDAVERKDKVLNIHFYLPIEQRPMADIMKGSETSDEIFEKGEEWVESLDCKPLLVRKESFGFVFNRIWHVIKRECLEIWSEGIATFEDVDEAWKIFTGMDIGPFAGMDAVGLDVVYDIEMSYYNETGNPKDKPPEELKEKVENGELGMKSGKGFYNWEE